MNALRPVLAEVADKIRRYSGSRALNEQNTKTALIDPVLRGLGWDVGNLEEVQQEYKRKPPDKPVDYALLMMREPRLFIEAKSLGKDLSDWKWANQIISYATMAGVEWVALTDGDEYRIFKVHAPVPIENKLFRTVRVSEENSAAAETLSLLSKDRLRESVIDRLWETSFVDAQVKDALESLFDGEADSSLVRLLRKRIDLKPAEIRGSLGRADIQIRFPEDSELPAVKPKKVLEPTRLKDASATRRERRRQSDTIVVPAKREGFEEVFLGENRWHAIRMGREGRKRVKYIAAYQSAPISAVTHMAEVRDIRSFENSGKYVVDFKGPCWQIDPVPLRKGKTAPQGPVYVKKHDLLNAEYLDEAFDLT